MKKLLLCFLCLCALLLGACTDKTDEPEDTNEETVAQTEFDGKVTLVEGGQPLYAICCTEREFVDSAQYMQNILKAKTDVLFPIVRGIEDAEHDRLICIGVVEGEENSDRIHRERVTYNGYGSAYKDGNIYLCGYTADNISIAVQTFLGNITNKYIDKKAEGGTLVWCQTSMMSMNNPSYSVKDAKLLGVSLGEYDIVLPNQSGDIYKNMEKLAQMLKDSIGKSTGMFVNVVSQADNASEYRIEVTYDKGLDVGKYSIKSEGTVIKVKTSGLVSMYAAFEDINGMLVKDTSDGISVATDARVTLLAESNPHKEQGTDLRIMSANVLGSGQEGKGQCDTAFRAAIMSEYVHIYEPDSIGVQEYYGSYTTSLMSDIGDKYAEVYFAGYGAPWVSTIYRKDIYTVVESNLVQLKVSGGQDYYFTWVALKNKTTEEIYVHGNLHLEYRGDTFRQTQAAMVNGELEKVMQKYPSAVVALTGDYNCKLGSTVLTTIKGSLEIEDAMLSAPTDKRDDKHKSFHTLCEYGSVKSTTSQALDHVLVGTATGEVLKHDIIYDELICHASDHYPVIVDIAKK